MVNVRSGDYSESALFFILPYYPLMPLLNQRLLLREWLASQVERSVRKVRKPLFSNTKHEISPGLYQSPMDPRNAFLRLLYLYHVKLKDLVADRDYMASLQPNCSSNVSLPIRVHSLSQVYFSSLSSNKCSGVYPRQPHCFKLSMI
jgi:hypothetical protein